MSVITNDTLAVLIESNFKDLARRMDAMDRTIEGLSVKVGITNGRVQKSEIDIAVLKATRVTNAQHELRELRANGDTASETVEITPRSVKRLATYGGASLVGGYTLVRVIWMLGDWLQKAGLR